jgi:carboxylesterase type B
LNVFTPILSQTPPVTPLPVMIFITGGNFQFLDASAPIYESERFVNTTNIVLVFIQYRLGKKKFKFYLS